MRVEISNIKIGKRHRENMGDLDGLAASIADVGLLHPPVVSPDFSLIVGARRIAAVKQLGWTHIDVSVAKNLDDAYRLLRAERDENVQREDPSPLEDHVLFLKLKQAEEVFAKARQAAGQKAGAKKGGETAGRGRPKASTEKNGKGKRAATAATRAAKATGRSEATHRKIAEVIEAAKQNPSFQSIVDKMNRTKNVDAALKEIRAAKQKAEAAKAAEEVANAPSDDSCTISVCSMQTLLSSTRNIDAIITDPPYPEKFLPLYGELAQLAKKALKPDGVLAVMCGQSYLPRIFTAMCEHMEYRWTMAYLTPGGQAVQLWDRKANTFWKPILIFGGQPKWIGDVVKSDVNDNDKRFHGWGQSESGMAHLVEALTKPGDLVCDPFLGAGTTAVVALTRGRKFIGCDIDADCVKTSQGRVALALRDMKKVA